MIKKRKIPISKKTNLSNNAKKKDIIKYLKLVDYINNIKKELPKQVLMVSEIIYKSNDKDKVYKLTKTMVDLLLTDESMNILYNIVCKIFDDHYNHDEIKTLIKIYKTPFGRSILNKISTVHKEVFILTKHWADDIIKKNKSVIDKLIDEMYLV